MKRCTRHGRFTFSGLMVHQLSDSLPHDSCSAVWWYISCWTSYLVVKRAMDWPRQTSCCPTIDLISPHLLD